MLDDIDVRIDSIIESIREMEHSGYAWSAKLDELETILKRQHKKTQRKLDKIMDVLNLILPTLNKLKIHDSDSDEDPDMTLQTQIDRPWFLKTLSDYEDEMPEFVRQERELLKQEALQEEEEERKRTAKERKRDTTAEETTMLVELHQFPFLRHSEVRNLLISCGIRRDAVMHQQWNGKILELGLTSTDVAKIRAVRPEWETKTGMDPFRPVTQALLNAEFGKEVAKRNGVARLVRGLVRQDCQAKWKDYIATIMDKYSISQEEWRKAEKLEKARENKSNTRPHVETDLEPRGKDNRENRETRRKR